MKRYILWDHDGVLVDTEPLYFEATRQAIRELGVDLEHAAYLADMARGRSAWARLEEQGIDPETIEHHRGERNRLYQMLLQSADIAIPGVEAVLRQLSSDYAMAIVTTAKKTDFELIHRQRDIVRHMDFVLANGDYARSKPAPDPYLTALQRFQARPREAVVVEDSERGLRSALAAGIDCVVVANDFVRGQNFSGATACIESLAELPGLLKSMR